MKTFIILIGSWLVSDLAWAQVFTEKISTEYNFENKAMENTLIVANINGSIDVVGYAGDKVVLEVEKIIQAKTQERLQKGKQEIQLGMIDRADTLIFYVRGDCNMFSENNKGFRFNDKRWGYHWENSDGDDDCRQVFEYKLNFTLKVPFAVHLQLSTINDGNITVENVKGSVSASNVNGSIKLSNLTKEASASTINGDVDIEYDHNPESDCRFYTLNGDINANFQKGLVADLSFESFNGSFFTNVNQLASLPPEIEKSTKGEGIKYKLKGNRYQIGKGGAHLDFETFNGNVYLKEKIN